MEKEKKVLGYLPRKGKESQVWHSGASVLGGGSVGEREQRIRRESVSSSSSREWRRSLGRGE